MSLRTRMMLLVNGLSLLLITVVAAAMTLLAGARARSEADARVAELGRGVSRIALESLSTGDDLLLFGYLRFLMKDNPELEAASVERDGHLTRFGRSDAEGLFYNDIPAANKFGAVGVRLGFSKEALRGRVRKAQAELAAWILAVAGAGLLLGAAGSLWLSGFLSGPIAALSAAADEIGKGNLDVSVKPRSKDELGNLAEKFNLMVSRLREHMSFKEELLSTLSHELNTPLGGLKGFIEYLQEPGQAHGPAEAEKQDAYRTMLDTVRQMQTSLENALSLFKLNTQPLSPTQCSLSTVVGDVLRLLAPTARSSGIELHGPGEDKVFLTADREMLRRIAINLVSNAIKYTPPGGSVRVRILEMGGRVHLSVADTGPGVRDEDRERIFTRFYRSVGTDGRARRIPGSGLGLAIAKQAVDLHGGKIWVDSKVGKGSIFHVMLPEGP